MRAKIVFCLVLLFVGMNSYAQEKVNDTPKKILIAYFSWGGNTMHKAQRMLMGAMILVFLAGCALLAYQYCS